MNALAIRANKTRSKLDEYTLKSMRHHAIEIKQLYLTKNPHWAVETGDLMVHCMKMLRLHGFDLSKMFTKACGRFEKKLIEKIERSG